jgi:RNA polymerase sigma-70 factor (ECF subfamily)
MDEDTVSIGGPWSSNDPTSLRDVFDASYRRLVVQLFGVTGSMDEAEDLVQEAFVRAAAAGRRFARVENPEAWLRTTAINQHRSRWRKRRNAQRARDRMVAPRDPEALESHLEIITALRALPEAQRQVIALFYLADLPVETIAEELGVPAGTVKSRLSRGREALASHLAYAEGGVPHV